VIAFASKEGDGSGDVALAKEPRAQTEQGSDIFGGAGAVLPKPPDGGGVVASIEDGGEWRHFGEGKPELRVLAWQLKVVDA
jgi:hypothetical protein